MANIKIAQLTNKTTLADTDIIIVESATATEKMTVANLKKALGYKKELWSGSHIANSVIALNESFRNYDMIYLVFALSSSNQGWHEKVLFTDLVVNSTLQVSYYGDGNITFTFPSDTSISFQSGLSASIRLVKVYGTFKK